MARTVPAPKPPEAAAAADPTPETTAPPPEAAAAAEASASDQGPAQDAPAPAAAAAPLVLMPEANGRTDREATDLLLEACDRWGVHPGVDQRPRELLSWRFYPADPIEGIAAAVVLVTAGGTKLKHFADGAIDADTDETLRRIFRAFEIDPRTKEARPAALPADQTLPEVAVTGVVTATTHQHRGGYLRRARP